MKRQLRLSTPGQNRIFTGHGGIEKSDIGYRNSKENAVEVKSKYREI